MDALHATPCWPQAGIAASDASAPAGGVPCLRAVARRRALVRRRLHRHCCSDALPRPMPTLAAPLRRRSGGWRWGDAHPAVFAHPLLCRLPVIGALRDAHASRCPATTPRSTAAARRMTQFQSVHGAGVIVGSTTSPIWTAAVFIMAPGQSGNLLSRHARDFLTRWRDGDDDHARRRSRQQSPATDPA